MAIPIIIKEKDGTIYFSLSNRPEFVCKILKKDYDNFIVGTRCWYIHDASNASTLYIRKNNYSGEGRTHIHLHRMIMEVGSFSHENVIDHVNKYGLDNTRGNLRKTDHVGNMQNRSLIAKHSYKKITINKVFFGENKKYTSYRARDRSEYLFCAPNVEKLKRKIDLYLREKPPN